MGLPDAVQRAPAQDPFQLSGGRLRQALAYWRKVFFLPKLLGLARDGRKDPPVLVDLVVRIVFLAGLLRIRSFNALEPKLAEPQMQRALDAPPRRNGKVCSVDVLGYLRLSHTEHPDWGLKLRTVWFGVGPFWMEVCDVAEDRRA